MSGDKDPDKRSCSSLPLPSRLFVLSDMSELCTLVSRPGMECMPLRSPTGPYHYHHVTDQTKSLQELQNEVGALLEFRDLVIETFPDLKSKMASSTANSTITGIPTSSLASSRREWEPGIRVRRKLTQKENAEISASSLIRSRSNSHSGKKEPKSGEGNGSVVQDSGFSTETSSSKETHSASSTTGAVQGNTASNSANHRMGLDGANGEDELLNLLDVIHRKSNRLREEVETLQNLEREKCRTSSIINSFQEQLERCNNDDVQILRKERDRLLDKLSEMEAETLSGRIKSSKMRDEVDALNSAKKELEEQLKTALSQKLELNSRIHDLHMQLGNKNNSSSSTPSSPESAKPRLPLTPGARRLSNDYNSQMLIQSPQGAATQLLNNNHNNNINNKSRINSSFTPVILKSHKNGVMHNNYNNNNINNNNNLNSDNNYVDLLKPISAENLVPNNNDATRQSDFQLGHLDGLVSQPNRLNKVRVTDSKKIAAILLETNIVELQRHLLTITVQNQVLQQRIEQATRSRIFLTKKLDKSKDEVDDLKFQLEEKSIELEGTKAQLRVIESKTTAGTTTNAAGSTVLVTTPTASNKLDFSPDLQQRSQILMSSSRDAAMRLQSQVSTPSMKAMIPLAMDEILQNSSSTESAQDQAERDSRLCPDTPKRRPSKIPLPGTKGYTAPKPPSGRNFMAKGSTTITSSSGPPSNRSLNRSSGSLYMKSSGPSSVKKEHNNSTSSITASSNNLNNNHNSSHHHQRSDSGQSWRKDSSLDRNRSSSIPVSAKATATTTTATLSSSSSSSPIYKQHNVVSSSPLPKSKRDSLTSRVKNLDSLSRMQSTTPTSAGTITSNNGHSNGGNINNNLSKSNSKKDLSSSFTTGQLRDRKQQTSVPVRRVSSVSVGRHNNINSNGDQQQPSHLNNEGSDNGKNSSSTQTSMCRVSTSACHSPTLMETLRSSKSRLLKSRNLINEYLLLKSSTPILQTPPPIFRSPGFYPNHYLSSASEAEPASIMSTALCDGDISASSSSTTTPTMVRAGSNPITAQPHAIFDTASTFRHCASDRSVTVGMMDEGERNRGATEIKYIDDNSIELLDKPADPLIVPEKRVTSTPIDAPTRVRRDNKCRLVGKVNPNILKTWEQLNGISVRNGTTAEDDNVLPSLASENDKQSCILYYRKPHGLTVDGLVAEEENGGAKNKYPVNKILHSESSGDFFDSIDQSITENTYDYNDHDDDDVGIRSNFYQSVKGGDSRGPEELMVATADEEEDTAAGDGMADIGSLDKKKIFWSIDIN